MIFWFGELWLGSDGHFIEAPLNSYIKNLVRDRRIRIYGYEIDGEIISYLNGVKDKADLTLCNSDYLGAEPALFDSIICNPPYMRFQKFLNRHDVLPIIEKQIGKKLIGYSNIASVFLVKALNELKKNGRLAFIMPFEFFNTGYGREIKQSLLDNKLLKQIVVFSNEKEIFPDAITTVCILLCKNDGVEERIKITQINSNHDLSRITDISQYYHETIEPSRLPSKEKWTPILLSLFSSSPPPNDFVHLSTYGSFTRGIATGANEFFALRKSDVFNNSLPDKFICKCITKSSQIRKLVFTHEDFDKLYDLDKPVYCLNITDKPSDEVMKYIAGGESCGFHERYLTKMRNPWYKLEKRKSAPILCGVFNRGRIKVIRNLSEAISFTCFHCFYPNMFGEKLLNKIFIYMLSNIGQRIMKSNKRSYGGNLDKFEPGDLNDILLPNMSQFEMISEDEANEIVKIAVIDETQAIQMSNVLIQRIIDEKRVSMDQNSVKAVGNSASFIYSGYHFTS
ncbi:Eco57I restriction-modification methylase domain-containing protein [Magnetovirga frankeli]|uniref:Eco57I restriction-modification methylase domain-containing protein n=1 Tax=Magnetovirga frankeli TaxID=947516 RepID=UPI0012931970|nr:Eco57I restriction-modification methylase domain-containing protein [gamma proteobacterium SS-5]